MRIAVNTRFLMAGKLEGIGYFMQEIFQRWVKQHPEHEFIFIFDRPFDPQFITAPNITPVVAGPPARHPVLWKWWYDVKVPAILRKYKADVFVSADAHCSLRTRVPQCIVVHDLAFLHYPSFIPRTHFFYYKRYTPKFLQKAKTVVTVSEFSKKDIIDTYHTAADKIHVVFNAARPAFHPLSAAEAEQVKQQYTAGREYFIYSGSIHPRKNLFNLLKAFSEFKKKQKSNWKLVIAGRLAWHSKSFAESIKTYKYRDDVVMTGYVPEKELTLLTGAAYAMVYPSLWEGFGVPVIEAMRCGVPSITSVNSAMQEIAGDAALYADPENFHDLADKMMLLYKDEGLRARLIEKGKAMEAKYNWDTSAEMLWDCVVQTLRTDEQTNKEQRGANSEV
jgi:glycosyltransferase involved in cell wall biosynthesis